MEYEPSGPSITSVIELKLDTTTMLDWEKHGQVATSVPHYQELLDFINLRAQASETSTTKLPKGELKNNFHAGKPLPSFVTTTDNSEMPVCVLCKPEKHLLFNCIKFKELPHEDKLSVLKTYNQCNNCLRAGHYARQCKSVHFCKNCRGQHHTLLHYDPSKDNSLRNQQPNPVNSHATIGLKS